MKKRVLALLICACMLIGMVPVFANEIAESGSTSSSSVEGTTSSETETGSTEGTGDASEPPVDNGDASEPPVDNGDTSEPPVDTGDTSEPPVDDGDSSEPPVDTGDSSEPPVDPAQPGGPEHPIVVPPENLLPSIPEFPNPFPPIELHCNCGAGEGEAHQPGCPLYVEPEVEFDAEALYDTLMAAETAEEAEALVAELTEEEAQLFLDSLTEEEYAALEEHINSLAEPMDVLDVVSVSDVAPFLAPVEVKSPMRRARMLSASTEENGLVLDKKAEKDGDFYKITLEAFVTGAIKISTQTIPSDIVLVLDVSGSMGNTSNNDPYITVGSKDDTSGLDSKYGGAKGIYQFNSWGWNDMRFYNGEWQYKSLLSGWKRLDSAWFGSDVRIKKIDALKISTQNFIDQVEDKSVDENGNVIDNRVAIVKFAGDKNNTVGNDFETGSNYNCSQIVKGLTSVNTGASDLRATITSLRHGGATSADYGMQYAETILNGIDSTRKSNRVVIMFTDGEPNHSNGFDNKVANTTIGTSKNIKAGGATVYTVGIFNGADDSIPISSNASNMNKYMHYVSSNFKNAENLANPGAPTYPEDKNQSYYLAADSASKLDEIFKNIAENIETGGASINLGADTEVRDIVSEYFDMPANANAIDVYTADYEGYDAEGNRVFDDANRTPYNADIVVDSDTKAVKVTNFDYSSSDNCVTDKTANGTTTYSGKKLIIEFDVTMRDGFWGGNGVPTNGNASAVYDKSGNLVKKFDVPHVNVPINIPAPGTKDLNVYYNGEDVPGVKDLNDGITLPTGENAWQDDYINTITYSMNGTVSMTQDGTYTITATAQPLYSGNYTEGTSTATAEVDVFTPTADFHDSVLYLMQTPVYADQNLGTLTWKHGDATSDTVNMFGREPAQTYTYDVTPNPLTENSTVQPTLSLNGTEYGGTETFTVHVKKPTVKWTDTSCYYGAIIPTSFAPVGDVIWALADGDTVPQGEYIEPTAPGLSYTFDVASNTLMSKEIVAVNAYVTILGQDATQFVTFTWEKNSEVCSADCTAKPESAEFRIHPKFCTLIVNKNITGKIDDPQDSFIFTVNGTGNKYAENVKDMKVTVQKDGQVTISGLPVGTYTVTEDTNWSWRYTTDDATDTATLSSSNGNDTTAITNTLRNEKWLSGSSIAENTWSANNTQVERTKGPGLLEKIRKLFG